MLFFIQDNLSWPWAAAATTLALGALGVGSLLVYYTMASFRPADFPPGPSPFPIIGNLPHIPPAKSFLKFHEWGKKYGSIIGLKLGPTNVVVLNDYKHVRELLDKRGSIYASRSDNHIANDIIYQNETHVLYLPDGPGWRKQRKILQGVLTVKSVDNMLPTQEAQATFTLHDFLRSPDGYYDHIRRYTTAVILSCTFGIHVPSFESPRMQSIYHLLEEVTAILEFGATPPVDAFPFLKYLPGSLSGWRKRAHEIRSGQARVYGELVQEVRDQIQKGTGKGPFMEEFIRAQDKTAPLSDEYIDYVGGVLIEASSDTTASTLLSFVTAMATHPVVLKECQKEMDITCGQGQSPTSQDLENMPYLQACMQEVLRWRPVAAGGIPHLLTKDDVYGKYKLPKGTVVFANTWAIHRTDEFDDPDSFRPERWLSNKFGVSRDSISNTDDNRRVLYGFGAGRRLCSGKRMAENTMLIAMAKLAWAFDIIPRDMGSKIDVDVETGYSNGFLITPLEAPIRFVPRSDKHVEMINSNFALAEKILAGFNS